MTVSQLQCHIEETVDLLQAMEFDGHFIVVFLDQIHAELRQIFQLGTRAIPGLKTVSMTSSYDDFMFDFRYFSENR